jgi:hypothetical protein
MKRPVAAALVSIVLALGAAPAAADEMSDVYARILEDPGNVALNLQYAALAEKAGKPRLALAAYERILLNDPGNAEAQEGIKRINRMLLGDSTRWLASVGVGWESNPALSAHHEKDSMIALASLAMHDVRNLGDRSWQTDGIAQVNFFSNQDELNYGFLGIETGPVFNTSSWFTVHPAVGVATSYFDHSSFYNEAVASLTFEGVTGGANQLARIKVGYRDYSGHFTSDSGWYVHVSGRWGIPHVFNGSDVIVLTPWFRWSDIEGGVPITVTSESEPGRYHEFGLDIAYYTPIADSVVVGANLTVWDRSYRDPGFLSGSDDRHDTMISPGATLIFKHVFAFQSDVRLQYRHRSNASNDDFREYEDDVVTLNLDVRF